MVSSPVTNCEGAQNKCQKLPALPNEIGLLIPITLIIEHSNEKWRRFNLTNWSQEWVYVWACVWEGGGKKKKKCLGQKRNFSVVRLHCSVIVEEEAHGTGNTGTGIWANSSSCSLPLSLSYTQTISCCVFPCWKKIIPQVYMTGTSPMFIWHWGRRERTEYVE